MSSWLSRIVIAAIMAAGFVQVVRAGNPATKAPEASISSDLPPGPVSFAQIPVDARTIYLSAESVKVNVMRSAKASQISVASNCPGHWNVTGSAIRQVAFSSTRKGASVRADAGGAHAIVNGKVYQLPRGSDGSIRSLQIKDGAVMINGQKVNPLPGSDKPGNCTGPDLLEVVVPESYRGGLSLVCHGKSNVEVDGWTGGVFAVNLNGESSLTAGSLSKLEKAILEVRGKCMATIKGMSAQNFVANINGKGIVLVENGEAEMSNATISGSGKMTLKGSFKNLKKSVKGTGNIEVEE